jgi:hypothetical protein
MIDLRDNNDDRDLHKDNAGRLGYKRRSQVLQILAELVQFLDLCCVCEEPNTKHTMT